MAIEPAILVNLVEYASKPKDLDPNQLSAHLPDWTRIGGRYNNGTRFARWQFQENQYGLRVTFENREEQRDYRAIIERVKPIKDPSGADIKISTIRLEINDLRMIVAQANATEYSLSFYTEQATYYLTRHRTPSPYLAEPDYEIDIYGERNRKRVPFLLDQFTGLFARFTGNSPSHSQIKIGGAAGG